MFNGKKVFVSYGEAVIFEDLKFQLGFSTEIFEDDNGKFEVRWM